VRFVPDTTLADGRAFYQEIADSIGTQVSGFPAPEGVALADYLVFVPAGFEGRFCRQRAPCGAEEDRRCPASWSEPACRTAQPPATERAACEALVCGERTADAALCAAEATWIDAGEGKREDARWTESPGAQPPVPPELLPDLAASGATPSSEGDPARVFDACWERFGPGAGGATQPASGCRCVAKPDPAKQPCRPKEKDMSYSCTPEPNGRETSSGALCLFCARFMPWWTRFTRHARLGVEAETPSRVQPPFLPAPGGKPQKLEERTAQPLWSLVHVVVVPKFERVLNAVTLDPSNAEHVRVLDEMQRVGRAAATWLLEAPRSQRFGLAWWLDPDRAAEGLNPQKSDLHPRAPATKGWDAMKSMALRLAPAEDATGEHLLNASRMPWAEARDVDCVVQPLGHTRTAGLHVHAFATAFRTAALAERERTAAKVQPLLYKAAPGYGAPSLPSPDVTVDAVLRAACPLRRRAALDAALDAARPGADGRPEGLGGAGEALAGVLTPEAVPAPGSKDEKKVDKALDKAEKKAEAAEAAARKKAAADSKKTIAAAQAAMKKGGMAPTVVGKPVP
jgi:hypothetical protein